MPIPRKEIVRDIVVSVVVSVGATVGVMTALTHNSAQASSEPQDGNRGAWTALEKAQAVQVLTAPPVLESPALAQCVIDQVSQQHSFADFLGYARMAAQNDFSNPDSTQSAVLDSLMFDALTCPEKN